MTFAHGLSARSCQGRAGRGVVARAGDGGLRGVAANPAKAQELIEAAKRSSMPELNDAVAKVKADSTDLEERRRARHGRSRPALATSPGATVLAIVCP